MSMHKRLLTTEDLLRLLGDTVTAKQPGLLRGPDAHARFLNDLAELVARHTGGTFAGVQKESAKLEFVLEFAERMPPGWRSYGREPGIRTYTTAPKGYDYQGVATLEERIAYTQQGKPVRLVSIPAPTHHAQCMRYGSGNHISLDDAMFREWLAAGRLISATDGPHYRIEYDPEFWGGDYNKVGQFAYVPAALAAAVGLEQAFVIATGGLASQHIVHYEPDVRYTANGKLWEDIEQKDEIYAGGPTR